MELSEKLLEQFKKDFATAKTYNDLMGKDGAIKKLMKTSLETMLDAEITDQLGYTKHSPAGKNSGNSRNGSYHKTVSTDQGALELEIPRDRNSEFEPIVVKKHETRLGAIEDKIISMYAKGMTTRDIQTHIEDIYGLEISPTLVSQITDKINDLAIQWQNRSLESIYPVVFFDAIHFKVKEICIACIDGLTGFPEAIKTVFPEIKIQRCIVHQIRNSMKYVASKDQKVFAQALKTIYSAPTEAAALQNLKTVDETWGKKYLLAMKSWRENWEELSTFFQYPQEIRTMIYTTNAVEALHRQFRKVTKAKSIFPNDEALTKMLFLAYRDIARKWTMPVRNWSIVLGHFSIIFDHQVGPFL